KQRRHAWRLVQDMWSTNGKYRPILGVGDDFSRHLQIGVAGPDEVVAKVISGIQSAGVDSALLSVIVELPFQITIGTGAYTKARNHWRKSPGIGDESNSGEAVSSGEDVACAGLDRAAESGIGKIFHFDVPGNKLVCTSGHAGSGGNGLCFG